MKKTISIILAVLMIFSCISIATVSAAETTTIKLNGTDYSYSVGSTINYECKLKYTADIIENGQFIVHYPNEVLKIEKIVFPVVNGAMYNYTENVVSQLRFNFSNINPGYNFKSEGVLVNVTFSVIKAGTGEISLEKEVLSNVSDVDVIKVSTFTESLTKDNICKHTTKKTVGARKATYFAKGYTGNKVCADCGVVIQKGKTTAKLKLAKPKMKATGAKKAINVKYTKVKGATGFQVSYTLKNKTKTKKFDTKKTTTKKIKNLKKGKKYSVKIRAYVKSGKKIAYSSWTKAKKVKVK